MAKVNFNAKDVDPGSTYEIIPEGWYPAMLMKSDYKPTKAADGHYLSLQFKILNGPSKGRVVFTNLNIDNRNETAVEIAERNFSQLCHAVGVLVVEDTGQLHGKPLEIKVNITPAQGGYEARNDIRGYRAIENAPSSYEEAPQEHNYEDAPPPDEMPAWMREDSE